METSTHTYTPEDLRDRHTVPPLSQALALVQKAEECGRCLRLEVAHGPAGSYPLWNTMELV